MNIYKKYTKEPYSFLVNDTTLPSDGPLRFRKNLLGEYIIQIMTIEDQIMKNYNMTLIERLRKYQLYHQVKLINMNTLLVKKYYHRINNK